MKIKILNSVLFVFALLISVNSFSQDKAKDKVYIKIEIKGMACPFCAGGMAKELGKIAGVKEVDLSFEDGIAFLTTTIEQKPSKEDLIKIVEDAGFDVGEIEYNNKPFKKNKE